MFSRYVFRSALLVSAALVLIPASAHAQTLEQAVQSALGTHPSAEAARAILDATKETKNEARASYFPDISVGAAAGRMYGDNATSRGLLVTRGSGYSNYGEGSIGLNQMIFDGLETPRRIDAANAREDAANANITDIRETLALRAVQSYVDLIRARKGLMMVDGHTGRVDDYLMRIADMVEQGASDEVELQQARDVSIILKAIRAEYEGQVMAAEARYAEVVGAAAPQQLAEPVDKASLILMEPAQAIAVAKAEHPALLAAQSEARAASHDIKAEEGTLYPDVNGELSYLNSDKEEFLGGKIVDGRALVRMSWNFSTGGEQLARIRRTKHVHSESVYRLAELERQIEQNVKLAYNEYANATKQLSYLHERKELNEKLYGAYEAQFEGARVNLLQLMQAHNQLFNTHLEVNNGYYRAIAAQYGVLASMGKLHNAFGGMTPPAAAPVVSAQADKAHEQQ